MPDGAPGRAATRTAAGEQSADRASGVEATAGQPTAARPSGVIGRLSAGLAGAAALIAVVTLVSRVVGFGRTLVMAHTVGAGNLGDAYNAANTIPNIVFNIVVGGALASVAVPLLAGPLARGARDEAGRVLSALLTWTLTLLVPLAVVGMALAEPIGHALAAGHAGGGLYAGLVSRFLLVFLPQLPLYGVAVVLSAALQADRRFLAPALGPLVSSIVVIAAYAAFGAMDGGAAADLHRLTTAAELVVSLGTTVGVAALAATPVPALTRTRLRLRPTLRFPAGFSGRARSLAVAGVSTLVAQQVVNLVIVLLTNSGHVVAGSLTVYTFVFNVYQLPYAVLAVPIATSAFTELSARYDGGQHDRYVRAAASTTRAVLLVACGGAALLAATAWPVSRVFTATHQAAMAGGLLAFAPGLLGFALIIHLGNVLYAAGRSRAAALPIVAGWLVVLASDIVLVGIMPGRDAVTALGLGNLLGMTVAGAALLVAVRRVAGRGASRGLARATLAGLLGGAGGALVGGYAAALPGGTGALLAVPVAVLAALVAALVFCGVVLLLDGRDLRTLLSRRYSRG